jgi:heme-degrading monooxygenase HmoA
MSICKTPSPPYFTVVFTSQRSNVDDGYAQMNEELYAEAVEFDGFIGSESLRDANGFGVTVLYWCDMESISNWARHAKHMQAKQQGKAHWYTDYRVRIAKVEREYGMH